MFRTLRSAYQIPCIRLSVCIHKTARGILEENLWNLTLRSVNRISTCIEILDITEQNWRILCRKTDLCFVCHLNVCRKKSLFEPKFYWKVQCVVYILPGSLRQSFTFRLSITLIFIHHSSVTIHRTWGKGSSVCYVVYSRLYGWKTRPTHLELYKNSISYSESSIILCVLVWLPYRIFFFS